MVAMKDEIDRILSGKTTENLSSPFESDFDLDFGESLVSREIIKPPSEKEERMKSSIRSIIEEETDTMRIRTEPIIEILSVSLLNQNQNQTKTKTNYTSNDDSNNESWELYGSVYVHDFRGRIGIGSNRVVLFEREEDIDDPEIIPSTGGALSLIGPQRVMSMEKPVIGIHISDKVTGDTLISSYAPLLKSIDTAQAHHQFEQFHKLTVPGTACSAVVEYLALTFGVHAHVEVQLWKQEEVQLCKQPLMKSVINEEDEEYLDIYGTISAAYDLYDSKHKINGLCINLFDINKDSDETEKVNLIFPTNVIPLSRSVVAVPAYSLLTIQLKLWDRAKDKLIVEGSYDFKTDNYPYRNIIVGRNGMCAKVSIDWTQPFLLDEPYVRDHRELFLSPPNAPIFGVSPTIEVFSVFIGRQNDEQLSLYGMVNFEGHYGLLNLFERDKTDPFILSSGCNFLPLKGPMKALLPHLYFFISVDLQDVEGRVSIKGLAKANVGLAECKGYWPDRLVCSVISRTQEHSFAAIHYTLFSHAVKATLKIRFFFIGEHCGDACCKIYGNIVARYSKYGSRTPYEKLYHQILLFERSEDNSLEVPCKEFDMELSRPVIAVPIDSSLRIAVNLSCQSSDFTQLLRGTREFQIVNGVCNKVTLEGDQIGINISLQY